MDRSKPLVIYAIAILATWLPVVSLALTISVQPQIATVCIKRSKGELLRCEATRTGIVNLGEVSAGTRLDVSSPGFVSSVVTPVDGEDTESVRLLPATSITWLGWDVVDLIIPTRLEWLPSRDSAFLDFDTVTPGETCVLPGRAQAVRFVPTNHAFSPYTIFLSGDSMRVSVSTAARQGGEVSLCATTLQGGPLPATVAVQTSTSTTTAATGPDGCLSVNDLPPGQAVVSTPELPSPIRRTVANVQVRTSLWLGSIRPPQPGQLTLRIQDAVTTHVFALNLSPDRTNTEGGISNSLLKRARGGVAVTWEVPPGDYVLVVTEPSLPGVRAVRKFTVPEGGIVSADIVFRFVRLLAHLHGRVSPGKTVELERRLADGSLAQVDCPVSTDNTIEASLPEPGVWNVFVADPNLDWMKASIPLTVPDVPLFECDLNLPDAGIRGKVFDARSGSGIPDLVIDIAGAAPSPFWKSVRSDHDGAFDVANLPAESIVIQVDGTSALGHHYRQGPRIRTETMPGSTTAVPIPLQPIGTEGDGATLHVINIDGVAVPLADVLVATALSDPPRLLGVTDQGGAFSLPPDMPAGTHLYILGRGLPWKEAQAPAPGTDATIAITTPAQVIASVLVRNVDGTPAKVQFWGLRSIDGSDVPLLMHILVQGGTLAMPSDHLEIPFPAVGHYELWVAAPALSRLGVVDFPAARPIEFILPTP